MSECVSYVWFPIEVVVDGDPQAFGRICYCKGVDSQVVLVFDWVIGSGFTFVRMEFHIPLYSHAVSFVRSYWRISLSFSDVIFQYRLRSLAKSLVLDWM